MAIVLSDGVANAVEVTVFLKKNKQLQKDHPLKKRKWS